MSGPMSEHGAERGEQVRPMESLHGLRQVWEVLTAHGAVGLVIRPDSRAYECTCGEVIEVTDAPVTVAVPDEVHAAHRGHIAAALAAAGIGDVAEAERRGAKAVLGAVVKVAPSLNMELRHDGTTDPQAAAYVEGYGDALTAAREAARNAGAR